MRKEPVVIGQIVSALGLVAMLWSPLGEAIAAAGGEQAVAGAIGVMYILVAYLTRNRVTPV